MMAIANPRIHIICGICGSSKFFKYEINKKAICDNDGVEREGVIISCDNCSSITGLDELMKEKKP